MAAEPVALGAPAIPPAPAPARGWAWAAWGLCALWFGCGSGVVPDAQQGAAAELDAGRTRPALDNASPVTDAGVASLQPPLAPGAVFTCDQGAASEPDGLRRLTMVQYRNTLLDLSAWALGDPDEAAAMLSAVDLDVLPGDQRAPTAREPHGSYRRMDQAVEQAHVEGVFQVAAALAEALTAPGRLERVVGPCAVDGQADNDDSCLDEFIQRFGSRALRRPLDADDGRFYRVAYGNDPAANPGAYADVITVMLSAPELVYFVEHGEAEVPEQPGVYALSAHELASRLSYHFWQTLPDEALWRAAEDGSLLEAGVLAHQVARLLADPRARTTMDELFGDYLRLDEVPELDAHAADPAFAAFAGADLPGPGLRQAAIDEALAMLGHYTWDASAGLAEVMTGELGFTQDAALASLYGHPVREPGQAPLGVSAGQHAGLLSRLWFLASGTTETRPIQRGVFIRRQLLCDDVPPPPPGVGAMPPMPVPGQTTREAVEALTEQPNTACAGCHASLINPLGFAFEGFDGLGRARSEQRVYAPDGSLEAVLPVDTATRPYVTPDDPRVSVGAADLGRLMLESGKLEACLARHYFRFTFGRYEDLERDGCVLEALRKRLVEAETIRDMLAEVALLPALRQRRLAP